MVFNNVHLDITIQIQTIMECETNISANGGSRMVLLPPIWDTAFVLESQQAFSMKSIVYTAELSRLPRLPRLPLCSTHSLG